MTQVKIDIVDVAGVPHDRGAAFGAARRADIAAYLGDWLASLAQTGIGDARAYVARMARETDFITATGQHAADLLEEAKGIAAGAGQPFELIFITQCMDEEWDYRRAVLSGAKTPDKCSSLAVHTRPGETWIAQNMDLHTYTDHHQVLMRAAPHGTTAGTLVLTAGSMIGLLGVNAHGVGVCVNSLPQLPAGRQGVPVAFVIRKILECANLDAAVRLLHALPHATGQHYVIADPDGARSFEASPAGVAEYRPADPARVFHTNHPLTAQYEIKDPAATSANSMARLASLVSRLNQGDVDDAAIQAALSSADDPAHPVCRLHGPGLTGFTTGSMVSALRRDAAVIDSWVSAGPPSVRGYNHFTLPKAAAGV